MTASTAVHAPLPHNTLPARPPEPLGGVIFDLPDLHGVRVALAGF